MALLVDAGPLYAYIDADDRHHSSCRRLLEQHAGPLLVPMFVVAEVAYLVASRIGATAEVRFLGDFASGAFVAEPVKAIDWIRIAELVSAYRDLPLGTVDASVVVAAERLGITTVASLDRRRFAMVRPAHTDSFDLLP